MKRSIEDYITEAKKRKLDINDGYADLVKVYYQKRLNTYFEEKFLGKDVVSTETAEDWLNELASLKSRIQLLEEEKVLTAKHPKAFDAALLKHILQNLKREWTAQDLVEALSTLQPKLPKNGQNSRYGRPHKFEGFHPEIKEIMYEILVCICKLDKQFPLDFVEYVIFLSYVLHIKGNQKADIRSKLLPVHRRQERAQQSRLGLSLVDTDTLNKELHDEQIEKHSSLLEMLSPYFSEEFAERLYRRQHGYDVRVLVKCSKDTQEEEFKTDVWTVDERLFLISNSVHLRCLKGNISEMARHGGAPFLVKLWKQDSSLFEGAFLEAKTVDNILEANMEKMQHVTSQRQHAVKLIEFMTTLRSCTFDGPLQLRLMDYFVSYLMNDFKRPKRTILRGLHLGRRENPSDEADNSYVSAFRKKYRLKDVRYSLHKAKTIKPRLKKSMMPPKLVLPQVSVRHGDVIPRNARIEVDPVMKASLWPDWNDNQIRKYLVLFYAKMLKKIRTTEIDQAAFGLFGGSGLKRTISILSPESNISPKHFTIEQLRSMNFKPQYEPLKAECHENAWIWLTFKAHTPDPHSYDFKGAPHSNEKSREYGSYEAETFVRRRIHEEQGRTTEPWELFSLIHYKWRKNLEFREIEFAKRVTKDRIVAEIEKAIELDDQIEVAELIAEFTLPVEKSRCIDPLLTCQREFLKQNSDCMEVVKAAKAIMENNTFTLESLVSSCRGFYTDFNIQKHFVNCFIQIVKENIFVKTRVQKENTRLLSFDFPNLLDY